MQIFIYVQNHVKHARILWYWLIWNWHFIFNWNKVTYKCNFFYPIVTEWLVTIAYALYLNYQLGLIECVYKVTQMCDQCDNITSWYIAILSIKYLILGGLLSIQKNCGTSRTSTTPTRNLLFFVLFVKEYPRQHRRHVCQFVIAILQWNSVFPDVTNKSLPKYTEWRRVNFISY